MKDREVEEAADERDRQKEIEHIDVARRKLIEERDPNAESIILQMEQKMQEHLRRHLLLDGAEPSDVVDTVESSEYGSEELADENPAKERIKRSSEHAPMFEENHSGNHSLISPRAASVSQSVERSVSEVQRQLSEFAPTLDDGSAVSSKDGAGTFGFAMSAAEPVVRKKAAAFLDEEVDEKTRKKHTPSWLPPSAFKPTAADTKSSSLKSDESASIAQLTANMTNEQKKAVIKRIIDAIPTGKRELFNYPIDWELVDANFVNARIKPWVDKKIVGYIGEAEATLSNFICDQLVRHDPPERILADIAMVLDEEAEVFVVKMWRLLIYVIAEKKAGLST